LVFQGPIDSVAPTPAWYAFILQSASGTVAIANWKTKPADQIVSGLSDVVGDFRVLDGDRLTPGKNAISIGEDPVAIATDKAGCFEITANAGSCDLSALEVNSALAAANGASETRVRVDRMPVKNANGGVILAKPAAMVAEPGTTTVGLSCPADGAGRTVPSGVVYIAYPSCHLVAGVDTATGTIVSAIRLDAAGTATILGGAELAGVGCPAECTSTAANVATAPVDALAARPVALDHQFDQRVDMGLAGGAADAKLAVTSRLAIGAENSRVLTVVDLSLDAFAPTSVLQVPLDDSATPGKLGITALSLSPQIGMGGNAVGGDTLDNGMGSPNGLGDVGTRGGQAQFVYAVTTDGTVRVADVLVPNPGDTGGIAPRECDTQIDGRYLQGFTSLSTDPRRMVCFALNDPTLPRRSGVRGPGIELPDHSVPISVAIVKGRTVPKPDPADMTGGTPLRPDPTMLVGYFAIVTASTGAAFVVNVDDDDGPDAVVTSDPFGTAPVLIMPHQLRDGFLNRGAPAQTNVTVQNGDGTSTTTAIASCLATDPLASQGAVFGGGPRVNPAPSQVSPTGTVAPERNGELPMLQQVACSTPDKGDAVSPIAISALQFGADLARRNLVFPDLKAVRTEPWHLTYEGSLSRDLPTAAIDGPLVRIGTLHVDTTGMQLLDASAPFCELGVEPGDIVDLRGCSPTNLDRDCPANYTCFVHPKSNVPFGACMLRSEAPRLADTCIDFLTTQRHYTVGINPSTNPVQDRQLVLLERKHELTNTPIDGCVSDPQCQDLAALAASVLGGDPDAGTTWACQPDANRLPFGAPRNRCVQTCSTDPAAPADCATGTVCRLDPGTSHGVCLEGVEPPQSCINGPQRFAVRASEAFTVIGDRSGYIHPFQRGANGACVRDPNASSLQIGRIPLAAPACDDAAVGADPLTGRRPDGTFEANPCATSVPQVENVPSYLPGTCTAATPATVLAMRTADAIKFRNRAMTLTMVDPTYPGDQTCIQDRGGNRGKIPFAVPGYEINFEQKAGYAPITIPVGGEVYPARVVRGPSGSIWIIDEGDFLATSFTDSSTRGRVYRVESIDTTVSNIMQ